MFNAHLFLKKKSPPGNPWIDDWKNNHVGFPCKRMHVSEIENQHSTVPKCAHIKNILFRAFWAALWSLQTLSNANTAENAVSQTPQNSPSLFLFPLSLSDLLLWLHYKFSSMSFWRSFSHFSLVLEITLFPSKTLQYVGIDTGVPDSNCLTATYDMFCFCQPAIPNVLVNKTWLFGFFLC